MTLLEKVRNQIGLEGPQLPHEEYEKRIDDILNEMSPRDLLQYISDVEENF